MSRPTLHLVIPGHPPRMPHPVVAAIARDTAPRVEEWRARRSRRVSVRRMLRDASAVAAGLGLASYSLDGLLYGLVAAAALVCGLRILERRGPLRGRA